MRHRAPFKADDLDRLDTLLEQAIAVVPMADIHAGARDPRIIGMRHDVDNDIAPAVEFAVWEAERGYRSTYYILHSAPYWNDKPLLIESLNTISDAGHEIGIHNNAVAEYVRTGRDPRLILIEAITELQDYGHTVIGTVAHGDPECRDYRGQVRFVNDQLFTECPRPEYEPSPVPAKTSLDQCGLSYDANWLGRAAYISDSGGAWSASFDETAAGFPYDGQLHMLVHPDWWADAFKLEVPA